MFYLRLLLLTALLPLSASAEMLLTSSWTINCIDGDAPEAAALGQEYSVTVRYDETAVPVYDEAYDHWDFTNPSMTMTLSIPEAGVELSALAYASLSGGDSARLAFASYFFSDELGDYLLMSLVFGEIDQDLLNQTALPTDASQLPTAGVLMLVSVNPLPMQTIQWIVGAMTEQPTLEPYTGAGSGITTPSGPYVGYDGPPIEEMPPLDIDLSTATLTLEQVPEPATWAIAGGGLALVAGVFARRRR
ncbi:MAG: PEP-CTERM sorting domain-containing protein [Verrucomicrobiota bacterium JB024]|nr:PEP-CTERM sorting domain-containing protein [Verrucomicrobiota bacterium JB024]